MPITLNSKMPFGKYKGVTVEIVVNQHSRYCKWLLAQPWLDSELCKIIRENSAICGVCNNSTKGMYAGEGLFIRCPGCGWHEARLSEKKQEVARPLFVDDD